MKSFSEAEAAVVAVDLGGTRLRAAVVHDDRVVSRSDGPTRATDGPEAVAERLLGHVRIALDEAAADGPPLPDAPPLVVAATGPVDLDGGWIDASSLGPAFFGFPLRRRLEAATGSKVVVGLDTHLALLGERHAGALRGIHDGLYATVSTGIGGALLVDDRLVLGAHGVTGEIGHLPGWEGGPRCSCGGRGHLEVVSSGRAIAATARRSAARLPGSSLDVAIRSRDTAFAARDVAELARAGDPAAARVLARARLAFARAIVALVNVVDFERVVLGGGVVLGDPEAWLDACRQELARSGLATQRTAATFAIAALGDDAALLGAADYLRLRTNGPVTMSGR